MKRRTPQHEPADQAVVKVRLVAIDERDQRQEKQVGQHGGLVDQVPELLRPQSGEHPVNSETAILKSRGAGQS